MSVEPYVATVAAAIDAYLRNPEPWLRELIWLAALGASQDKH